MNEIAALLIEFGFTPRDAGRITQSANENNLSLADVQAWINEAQASTSLHNPRGFVRARIQDGDKIVHPPAGDPHVVNRQRYKSQFPHTPFRPATRAKYLTQACKCGIVVYTSRICPDCGTCPRCCTCDQAEPDKE